MCFPPPIPPRPSPISALLTKANPKLYSGYNAVT